MAPFGTTGLLLGQIVSLSAGAVAILRHSSAELLRSLPSSPAFLLRTLRRYSHFGIYSSSSGFINLLANSAPIILFSSLYGSSYVGQLLVAQKILLAPVNVISISVGKVFLQKLTEANRQYMLLNIFIEATKKVILILSPLILLLVLLISLFSGPIFGRNWAEVGVITPLLVPLVLSKAVVSTVGQTLFALEMTRFQLLAQIIFMAVSLLPFAIFGFNSFPFWLAVLAWSIFSSLGYILFWLLCFMGAKQSTA